MADNLARTNKLMHDWGDWVVDGKASPGVFGTSAWSEGRPIRAPKRPKERRRRDKALVPQPVPHETRQVRPKIPCIRVAYLEERIHRLVVTFPESILPIVCCLWVNKKNYGDTALCLGMKSKQVVETKRKCLKFIRKHV